MLTQRSKPYPTQTKVWRAWCRNARVVGISQPSRWPILTVDKTDLVVRCSVGLYRRLLEEDQVTHLVVDVRITHLILDIGTTNERIVWDAIAFQRA